MINAKGFSAVLLASLCCIAPVDQAAARDEPEAETGTAPILAVGRTETPDRDRLPLKPDRSIPAARAGSIDWGDGGLALWGERTRTGSKQERSQAPRLGWRRTITANASAWQTIAPDIDLSVGARISRTKSGSGSGALNFRPTGAMSQEAFVKLQGSDRIGLQLSVFDNGGWSPLNLDDAAARMTNGEKRAKKGTAIEFGLLDLARGDSSEDQTKLAIRLERATSPFARPETSLTLAWKVRF